MKMSNVRCPMSKEAPSSKLQVPNYNGRASVPASPFLAARCVQLSSALFVVAFKTGECADHNIVRNQHNPQIASLYSSAPPATSIPVSFRREIVCPFCQRLSKQSHNLCNGRGACNLQKRLFRVPSRVVGVRIASKMKNPYRQDNHRANRCEYLHPPFHNCTQSKLTQPVATLTTKTLWSLGFGTFLELGTWNLELTSARPSFNPFNSFNQFNCSRC